MEKQRKQVSKRHLVDSLENVFTLFSAIPEINHYIQYTILDTQNVTLI